jgi:hypothetical protein
MEDTSHARHRRYWRSWQQGTCMMSPRGKENKIINIATPTPDMKFRKPL